MHSNNSYAQAGWSTLQSPYSTSNGQWGSHISTPASVYGALPTASIAPTPDVTTFQFTSFDPTILNCIVIGPRSRRYSVITASNVNTHTFFYDQNGRNFAAIEWAPFSSIEIYSIVPKQKISDWIKLSASQRCVDLQGLRHTNWRSRPSQMSLEVFGKRYKWMPNGNTFSVSTFQADLYTASNLL